jgi:SAM-dependent methyltransferase
MPQGQGFIDVRQLIGSRTVAEHNALAEDYFAKLTDWTYHLGKPFTAFDETPQLLVNFAIILQGLDLCPGLTVLEFGAGTCWASHWLTQLGCRVIAVDVSPTALKIGAKLYETQPPFGEMQPPQFVVFDGQRLPLPDASVDRIMCLDAFHHVPNPAEVLAEMARVLVPGGIAGFAEPGPEHSRSETSQYEMQQHGVIENDVDLPALWAAAQRAGFTDLKIAAFNQNADYLSLNDFNDFLAGGATARDYTEATRRFLRDKRNFFLYKGTAGSRDSRFRAGLKAEIRPLHKLVSARADEPLMVRAAVKNTSAAVWLPPSAGLGAVYLGFHVKDCDGAMLRQSYHWEALTPDANRAVPPGETVTVEARLPALPPGRYVLELDLVSNDVCWFALNGSPVGNVEVEVVMSNGGKV